MLTTKNMITPIKTTAPMIDPAAIPTILDVFTLELESEDAVEDAAALVKVVDDITLLELKVLVTVVAMAVRVAEVVGV